MKKNYDFFIKQTIIIRILYIHEHNYYSSWYTKYVLTIYIRQIAFVFYSIILYYYIKLGRPQRELRVQSNYYYFFFIFFHPVYNWFNDQLNWRIIFNWRNFRTAFVYQLMTFFFFTTNKTSNHVCDTSYIYIYIN